MGCCDGIFIMAVLRKNLHMKKTLVIYNPGHCVINRYGKKLSYNNDIRRVGRHWFIGVEH